MSETVIYGSLGSPYAARVVLAAWLKGIDFRLELPRAGIRTEDFLALNPMGKIPVLIDGSVTLPESEVICEYLEDRYPEPALLPADAVGKSRVRLLGRLVDEYLLPAVTAAIRLARNPEPDVPGLDGALAEASRAAGFVAHYMGPGPFAFAGEPTLADCAIAPAFYFVGATLGAFDGIRIIRGNPRTEQWWQHFQATPTGERYVQEADAAFAAFRRRRSAGGAPAAENNSA